jgi:hypothetical protein
MKLERNGQQGSACHHGARQEGAILVEFALVLPLLLLLLLGTVEFGRAINYWIDETHLANAAARWAAVDKNPGPGSSLQESILSEADTTQLREGAKVCINLPPGSRGKVGEPVEATVSYGFNWMPFIRSQLGVTTTTLSGAATMRLEQAMTISHTEC